MRGDAGEGGSVSLVENKVLVRDIFEKGLNEGQVDLIANRTADDFIDHDIHVETGIAGGPEDMRQALKLIIQGFPDVHVTIEDIIAEGDRVVVRNTWRGTHRGVFNGIEPTGRPIEIGGIVIWRIEEGKIAERWANIDTAGLLRQLGVG
jgi:steroid delta-isomerase-like uncharacterized protein